MKYRLAKIGSRLPQATLIVNDRVGIRLCVRATDGILLSAWIWVASHIAYRYVFIFYVNSSFFYDFAGRLCHACH